MRYDQCGEHRNTATDSEKARQAARSDLSPGGGVGAGLAQKQGPVCRKACSRREQSLRNLRTLNGTSHVKSLLREGRPERFGASGLAGHGGSGL